MPALNDKKTLEDIPALDGLRAFAVISVMIGHLVPIEWLQKFVGWGDLGVVLFFCLSGFLITNILLRVRDNPARQTWQGLRGFYGRRFLRIFPIYYLVIGVAILVGHPPSPENLPRLLTYSLNFPGLPPSLGLDIFSHLWSLSVEEQYYLIWPLLVLFVPARRLIGLLSLMILGSLAYKVALVMSGDSYQTTFRPITGCVDSLGLGSLAAHFYYSRQRKSSPRPFSNRTIILLVLPIAVTTVYRFVMPVDPWYHGFLLFGVWQFFFSAVAFASVILYVAEQRETPVARFLSAPLLRSIARISYGLYVYHFLTPTMLSWFSQHTHIRIHPSWVRVVTELALSYGMASLSYRWIEKPILGLKRYFPYSSGPQSEPADGLSPAGAPGGLSSPP